MNPIYRLTVYAPASGSSETTVLTPASDAIHSDPFQVASATGIAGYQPFLSRPSGYASSVNLPSAQTSIGSYTFTLYDLKLSPAHQNVQRWVTAFVGDNSKRLRIVGRKAVIEESRDDGATWHLFYEGRITEFELSGVQTYTVTIQSGLLSLKNRIMETRPPRSVVNYVSVETLLPLGFSHTIGSVTPPARITGTITGIYQASTIPRPRPTAQTGTRIRIQIDPSQRTRKDNRLTPAWTETAGATVTVNNITRTALLAHITNANHNPTGEPLLQIVDYETETLSNRSTSVERISAVIVEMIPGGFDPSAWNVNDSVSMYCYADEGINDSSRMWLEASPIQVWLDILLGNFSVTESFVPVAYDSAAFATLLADPTIPTARFAVAQSDDMASWVEKYICLPYGLAYSMRMTASGSLLYPFKTSLPSSLPSATITNADIIAGSPIEWNAGEPLKRITVTSYEDVVVPFTNDDDPVPPSRPRNIRTDNLERDVTSLIKSYPVETQYLNTGDIGIAGNDLAIDAIGNRWFYADVGDYAASAQFGQTVADAAIAGITNRFLFGCPTVKLDLHKTTNILGMNVGDYVITNVDQLPNSNTHLRGGSRLMQITEYSPQHDRIQLTLLDGALTASMATPTLNSVSAFGANNVQVSLTTVEDANIELQIALTGVGASQPLSSSPLWHTIGFVPCNNTTVSYWFGAPKGHRVWVRARSFAPPGTNLKLPSGYTAPGSAYLDLAALSAPTGLTITGITPKSFTSSWTPTEANAQVQVLIASPSGSDYRDTVLLMPGSNHWIVTGADSYPASSFTVGVRHVDDVNASAITSRSFGVSGSAATLPSMSYVLRLIG